MLKQLLFKRTALGIYCFEMSYVSSINEGIITSRYGFLNKSRTTYSVSGTQKQYESAVLKKIKEGYKSNIDLGLPIGVIDDDYISAIASLLPVYNTDINSFYKSMKCQPFVPNKFTYDALGQPKINGGRMSIRWGRVHDGLFSYDGPILTTHEGIVCRISHIEEVFKDIFKHCHSDTVFDGEIYHYGSNVTMINGAARNPRNPIHDKLQYQCFDLAIPKKKKKDRISMRDDIFKKVYYPGKVHKQTKVQDHNVPDIVVNVYTKLITSDDDASNFRYECIEAGYEGCVIRNMDAPYKFGSRPMTMMKLKKSKLGKFKVIDLTPFGFENTDNNIGKGIRFLLKNDINDEQFDCNSNGSVDKKLKVINSKAAYIGKEVTVQYFERTPTNLPFHATVILE